MLKRLKTRCFRQHRDAEWMFGTGLAVIRGPNEAGKSNLLAAVLYALGGAKTLSRSLDKVVTWGYSEADLKVEADIEVGGVLYTFSRGAAGAECNFLRDGEPHKVVGQNEVTKFACELLGAPNLQTLTRLMLAKQNAIRGALEEGDTKLAEQIEMLASFDFFDTVLKAIESNWVTGPTKPAEQACAALEQQIRALALDPPDQAAHEARIAPLRDELDVLATTLAKQAQPAYDVANTAFQTVNEQIRLRRTLAQSHDKAVAELERLTRELEAAERQAAIVVDEAAMQQAGQRLADVLEAERRVQAWQQVQQAMATYPEVAWEGDRASFDAEKQRGRRRLMEIAGELGRVDGDIRVKRSQIVTSSICGYCQQDLSQFPEIAKANQQREAEVKALLDLEARLKAEQQELKQADRVLDQVGREAERFDKVAVVPEWVERDTGWVPARLVWKGPAPLPPADDPDVLRQELQNLSRQAGEQKAGREKVVLWQPQVQHWQEQVRALREELDRLPEQSAQQAYAALADAQGEVERIGQAIRAAQDQLARLEQRHQEALAVHAERVRQHAALTQQLAQAKAALADQVLHNEILKRVRQARPLIADQLWNRILEAVSVIVTQMRGQPSVVTKAADGFRLNGTDIMDYSGSTIDLVGLAVRTALVQTFLPHVQMLVLDEATAACDDTRTAAMLGYLASSGFEQILLITHEEISETFADQVVQL